MISSTTASRKRFSCWNSDGNVSSCFIQQVDQETKLSVINKKEDKPEIKHTTKKITKIKRTQSYVLFLKFKTGSDVMSGSAV